MTRLRLLPQFLGAEPYEVEKGTFAGRRALSHEVERGYELLHALDADQQKAAILMTDIPGDVFEGPGRKQSLSSYEGIAASASSDQQQTLLAYRNAPYISVNI